MTSMYDLTIKQVASMGGKARWKKILKKERSEAMKRVRRGEKLDKQAQVISK